MNDEQAILPAEIKERLGRGEKLVIIDVREDEEVAAGMIPGAVHIPLAQIPDRMAEIPQAGETIMVCRSGNRSGKACNFLRQMGFTGLKNMTGGMMAWEQLD